MTELQYNSSDSSTELETNTRLSGEIDFWNSTGEYGFILPDGIDKTDRVNQPLFHLAQVTNEIDSDELNEGDIVEFEVEWVEESHGQTDEYRAYDVEVVETVEPSEDEEDDFEPDNWAGEDSNLSAEQQQNITDICEAVKDLNQSDKRLEDELSEL